MARQLGTSFAPTFEGADQARTTPSPAQGSVQTLSFQLPAQKSPQSVSPLVSQQYGGGVNSAVLEAALRSVFGPQAQMPQMPGAPSAAPSPQAPQAPAPQQMTGGGGGGAPQFMGNYDVPSFNGVGLPGGGGSIFDSPEYLQYLDELDRAQPREGYGSPRIHVDNFENMPGFPAGFRPISPTRV